VTNAKVIVTATVGLLINNKEGRRWETITNQKQEERKWKQTLVLFVGEPNIQVVLGKDWLSLQDQLSQQHTRERVKLFISVRVAEQA